MIGTRINHLEIISEGRRKVGKHKRLFLTCRCLLCDEVNEMSGSHVKSGATKTCRKCSLKSGKDPKQVAWNSWFSLYGGRNRLAGFALSREESQTFCSQNCHYCGLPPQLNTHARDKALGMNARRGHNPDLDNINKMVIYTQGIDRVNSDLGYLRDNIVPCCTLCNRMKSDHLLDTFLAHAKRIAAHNEQK